MKCRECGAEMRVAREAFPYPDLPGVVLHGVEVRRCVRDPEHFEVELPQMDGLHRALAGALLAKRARLSGPEIRFLRELSGWDAAKLAPLLDVTPTSLSRWENDQSGHSGMADRLIRMLAAEALGLHVPREVLEHLEESAPATQMTLRFGPGGWYVVDESDPVSVWVSFAEADREAVLKAFEALFELLAAKVLDFGHHSSTEAKVEGEDPGRALRVAVETLRALRPAEEQGQPSRAA